MMIQTGLELLKELSSIEKQISALETEALKHNIEISYESLVYTLAKDIADKSNTL